MSKNHFYLFGLFCNKFTEDITQQFMVNKLYSMEE